MMRTPFGRGWAQETVCIKLDLVNGWLFDIDSSRIKDEAMRPQRPQISCDWMALKAAANAARSRSDANTTRRPAV